ncbi:hypothetical protein L3Q82_017240, partial [Scortum barcoo]
MKPFSRSEENRGVAEQRGSRLLLTGAIEAGGDGVQEGVLRGQQPSHHRHPAPGRLSPPASAARGGARLLLRPETRQEAGGARCASQPLEKRTDPRYARWLHLGTAGVVTIIKSAEGKYEPRDAPVRLPEKERGRRRRKKTSVRTINERAGERTTWPHPVGDKGASLRAESLPSAGYIAHFKRTRSLFFT